MTSPALDSTAEAARQVIDLTGKRILDTVPGADLGAVGATLG